ncbi:hypothetical protein [Domibacillus indicus]|uniref:hypothetical protein n=1 Tax=Domibacillus indicus TaxID=1437523 RepID=UPI000617C85A|nr:hypothetical protein [Domibacillus indicus]
MPNYYIAVQSFLHQIDCSCPDKEHSDTVKIDQGDIISVYYERTHTTVDGWFVLIEVNQRRFYISINDLERYYSQGFLFSGLDIELQLNYLKFHIDESLDHADEGKFKETSKKWTEAKMYNEKLEAAAKSSMEVSL